MSDDEKLASDVSPRSNIKRSTDHRSVSYLNKFLDAFSHIYKRVCPYVGPSVTHELNF